MRAPWWRVNDHDARSSSGVARLLTMPAGLRWRVAARSPERRSDRRQRALGGAAVRRSLARARDDRSPHLHTTLQRVAERRRVSQYGAKSESNDFSSVRIVRTDSPVLIAGGASCVHRNGVFRNYFLKW